MTDYAYIVVGGGTAGCVLAARLAEDAGTQVLLLEAGSAERPPAMTTPDTWPQLLGTAANWGDLTTGQADTGPVPYPQGRALGGGGAINAMAHLRGHRAVYDGWAAAGAAPRLRLRPHLRRQGSHAGISTQTSTRSFPT